MKEYLNDVPLDKAFEFNGKKITNLHGLLFELRNMTEEEYSYHVGINYNHFADWILHVIKNRRLSRAIREKTRKEAVIILEKEIESLESGEELEESIEEEEIETNEEIELPEENIEELEEKKEETINEPKKIENPRKKISDFNTTDELLKHVSDTEEDIKVFLWKHFTWDLAKEFMAGMGMGIFIGFVLAKVFQLG